jgi:hypothetical protein
MPQLKVTLLAQFTSIKRSFPGRVEFFCYVAFCFECVFVVHNPAQADRGFWLKAITDSG